jgi:adenylylsulfate kinase
VSISSELHLYPAFEPGARRKKREELLRQRGKAFWLTGLSGSGKSTLALEAEKRLTEAGYYVVVLDGDNLRTGINANLGFAPEDRTENIRRTAEIAKLFVSFGAVVLLSLITPLESQRTLAKNILGADDFYDIFIDTPMSICEKRDTKGLYALARAGQIKGFTGIDSAYEVPVNPTLRIVTKNKSIADSASILYDFIIDKVRYSKL